ncbi:MAG TPA: hypothetical protein VGO67_17130 [Verrucomicrobiae bacterium]|jgi:hypothetical protein
MKYQRFIQMKHLAVFVALLFAASGVEAQMGGAMVQGPQFTGPMAKLFGDHQAFSATLAFQTEGGASGKSLTMGGSMAYLNGVTRFEMDMTKMQGANIKPQAMAQMKRMGMDKIIVVSIPEKKVTRMMYPSMNAYVESALPDASSSGSATTDYKLSVTEIGSDTIDGHPCVKNKVVVTEPSGTLHESTVWNAKDMDKFPLKIEMSDNGKQVSMMFKDVKLDKPDAALFEPPAGSRKYDSMMDMMMSRARGGQ